MFTEHVKDTVKVEILAKVKFSILSLKFDYQILAGCKFIDF